MRLINPILALALATTTLAFQFFLEAKSKKCFREDIPLSTDAIFSYNVAQGDGEMPVSFTISDSTGHFIQQKMNVDHGVYSFRSPNQIPGVAEKDSWALHDDERDEADDAYWRSMPLGAGDNRVSYRFCFEHSTSGLPKLYFRGKAVKRRVIFDVKFGSNAKTMEYYDKLAKEKHLSSTEELFRVVEDRVSDIVRIIDEMRQRELRLNHLNTKTDRAVLWYSLLTCFSIAAGAMLTSYGTFRQLSRQKIL